jgi:truncated hemoglobin YjbI
MSEKEKIETKDFTYKIPDEYWEKVHKLDYLVENFKVDPVDTERHINFKVQDATGISSREEVERQHKAWHERQKVKEKVMGELEEALAIIDDDSTNPEGAELTDQQKAELKEVVKKAFEEA